MSAQIEVVFENGVFRPLGVLSDQFKEQEHFMVTIENSGAPNDWLMDADLSVSLEEVRRALGKSSTTLAQHVSLDRDER